MNVRRVVTGNNANGASVFASDGVSARLEVFDSVPGMEAALVWATDDKESSYAVASVDDTPSVASWVPGQGASRLMVITFPPDSVFAADTFDPAAAALEYLTKLPGLAETFDPEVPGMHATATLDYGVVLEGEIWLELGGGEEKRLGKHDVVVQRGTRHAWRNKSAIPATVLFVLLGATRSA